MTQTDSGVKSTNERSRIVTDGGGVQCDYCDRSALAYKLQSNRGEVEKCIPCLAIEQGQQQLDTPFSEFIDNEKHETSPVFDDEEHWREHRELAYQSARDWWTVLARIQDDEVLVKRDPEAIGALNEHTRTFLINIMGDEAHHPPSEVVGSEVHAAQVKLGGSE